jgi:hypothetical protein
MNSIMPYASQMPSSVRYQMTQDANNVFSMLCLSFFFAYMGYKILMDYNKSQNRMEDRMKVIEGHMEAIEENAQYINNEIVNHSETLKVLRDDLNMIVVMYELVGVHADCPESAGEVYKYIRVKRGIDIDEILEMFKEIKKTS